jgi:hypothetical protein
MCNLYSITTNQAASHPSELRDVGLFSKLLVDAGLVLKLAVECGNDLAAHACRSPNRGTAAPPSF